VSKFYNSTSVKILIIFKLRSTTEQMPALVKLFMADGLINGFLDPFQKLVLLQL
jgi:hypothetical protein